MSLLSLFRKRDSSVAQKELQNETLSSDSSQNGLFKGDLALLGELANNDSKIIDKDSTEDKTSNNIVTGDTDSSDSVVFLSFETREADYWICPECGTYNAKNLNGCVVCGYKEL